MERTYARDVRGANGFGIRSVLIDWSKRRTFDEQGPLDHACYRIHTPAELLPLVEKLEAELR